MMGSKARIFAPIAVASLEDLVPSTHFYRRLDHVLDLSFVRDLVKEMYAHELAYKRKVKCPLQVTVEVIRRYQRFQGSVSFAKG